MDTIILGGIILGITQLAKITLGVSKRYIPITCFVVSAIVFGTAALLSKTIIDWTFVSSALVVALTAMGLWSGTKSTLS